MTPRPCTWPDGGCGEPVLFFPTGKTKPNGKPVLQIVDAKPEKRVVLVPRGPMTTLEPYDPGSGVVATVVDAYVDHHTTCRTWLARVERDRRERAAGQATKAGRG